ncbi:CTD small phosphatase-like protein 2-A [Sinocyclocheilus anshuiensis]|uniref:CTD small phosphatase-like protein 2-A n=1 Tax=Sinocyclocheilus anshuiensis TaxID=1608454 RepID=UPI0007B9B467|nr:PREDICTED: CTD small phosphatase-like protein 2-A [Sinocyclocheilus anshuiensis]
MRLRSRNILNENPTTPSRRRRAAPETPGPQTPQVQTQDEVNVLQDCLNLDADEVPTVAKRPRRRRKPLSTVDNKDGMRKPERIFVLNICMFVYTSAKKEYAEKTVDILDPNKKLFRHRLYQDDCACVLGHYIKDLTVLERDLSKTVILDNAPHTFPYHLMNMIPIKSWVGDQEDRELQKLIPYMEKLVHADDIRNVLKKRTDHFHRLLSED